MTCDIGDVVELTATFTDPGTNESVDPDEVTCTVLSPAGETSTPAVSGSDGVYTAEVEPDADGEWRFAFDGTGENKASAEGRFSVRKRRIPRD